MLIRQTLAYLPAQLLSPLLQLAVALVLTHALGAADYGLTLLVFASQELVFLVCLSWWTTFYLRYGVSGGGHPQTLAGTEAAVLLGSCAAQVVLTLGVIAITEPGVSWQFYAGACLFTVTRSQLGFLSERARRETAIGLYSLLQIGAPAAALALTAAWMALGRVTPEQVLWVFALMQALVAGAVTWRLGLLVRPRGIDLAVLRAAAAFGRPVVLANALSWLGGNGIRFVVQQGAGAAALGLLSVGWGLATRLAGVAAMLVTAAAYPLAVKAMQAGDAAGAKRQLADNSALLLALLAPATAAMAALGQPFTEWLVAAPYQAMTVAILPWALLGAAIRNLRMHGWDPLYLLCEAPRAMLVLDAIEAALTVAAAALGLWLGGGVGAVAGTAVAAAAVAVGDYVYLRRRLGLQAPLAVYARLLLAAGLVYGLTLLAGHFGWPVAPSAAGLCSAAAAGAVVYGLALVLLFPHQAVAVRAWAQRQRLKFNVAPGSSRE